MKKLRRFDPGQDEMRLGKVWTNARSRDDIPKLLGGLMRTATWSSSCMKL